MTMTYPSSKPEETAADLLTSPTEVRVYDIYPFAEAIMRDSDKWLRESPKGIYIRYRPDPIMSINKHYITPSGNSIKTLEDVINSQEDIYEVRKTKPPLKVYSPTQRHLLSLEPPYPTPALNLITSLIISYVEMKFSRARIEYHLTPIGFEAYKGGDFDPELYLAPLLDSIDLFIGNDIYHIYEIHRGGARLHIQKYVDFRIYEWHLQQDQRKERLRRCE